MNVISNCPLCEEHSLHVIGENEYQTQQCISCGYVTAEKFKYNETKETNDEYNKLPDDMKSWAKTANNRVWIPTIMTLPIGMLYPFNVSNPVNHQEEMKWGLAKMIDIPEEEQKDYPIEGQDNKFYEKRYDIENVEVFDEFFNALSKVNEILKKENESVETGLKLPKLKKV
tara:strand:+ start:470 stop:982 length:513 start_codon:yes stop_codon:yes gene_type:complete